jgi:hypothetical protein
MQMKKCQHVKGPRHRNGNYFLWCNRVLPVCEYGLKKRGDLAPSPDDASAYEDRCLECRYKYRVIVHNKTPLAEKMFRHVDAALLRSKMRGCKNETLNERHACEQWKLQNGKCSQCSVEMTLMPSSHHAYRTLGAQIEAAMAEGVHCRTWTCTMGSIDRSDASRVDNAYEPKDEKRNWTWVCRDCQTIKASDDITSRHLAYVSESEVKRRKAEQVVEHILQQVQVELKRLRPFVFLGEIEQKLASAQNVLRQHQKTDLCSSDLLEPKNEEDDSDRSDLTL